MTSELVLMPKAANKDIPLEQWTDEELLLTYREENDRKVFHELVSRYERELYSYLYNYLGNADMAEDVFQATFLQVHLKCDRFEEGRRVRPWLYTVAMHQAIDALRRNKKHSRVMSLDQSFNNGHTDNSLGDMLSGEEDQPGDSMQSAEQREAVRQAVGKLPESLREATDLVFFQGLKYREAAERLSIPVGTVKSRVHSAFQRLGELLKDIDAA